MKENQQSDEKDIDKSKVKSNAIMNALLIGIMIGIIVWSIAKSTVGLFTLIPLYFIHRLVNRTKSDKA